MTSIRARKPVTLRTSKADRAEVLFLKYKNLALSAAGAVGRKSGIPYSELEGEATSILAGLVLENWDHYDPEKSLPSTWIYTKVYRLLQNYVSRVRPIWRSGKCLDVAEVQVEAKRSRMDSLLAEVGDEGWALLKIICEAPGDLAHALTPSAPARSAASIRQYLTEGHWKEEMIDRAFSQVEHCLERRRGSPILFAS